MSRKKQLNERSARIGAAAAGRHMSTEARIISRREATSAFEAGYRAAMRDARKAYNSHRRYSLRCIALVEWLRPLR